MRHNHGEFCRDNFRDFEAEQLKKDAKLRVRICATDTDSDSDCVRIGDRSVRGMQKQIDDNGNLDSSIYQDSNCDPRFSSCDTNSNSAYSNTDSGTVETEEEEK